MHCDRNQELIADYVADELSEAERQAFRAHLRDCPACRERAVAADPSLLFATLTDPPVDYSSDARAEACAQAVTTMIRQQRLAENLGRRRRLPRALLAAAATVVMAVGAAMFWQAGWQIETATGEASTVVPAVAEAVIEAAPPRVEVDMGGDGVRVYHMSEGASDNTAVCFVVNEALEL